MEDKLNELLKQEEEYRKNKNNQKSISTIREIIQLIKDSEEDNKYNIISKLFLYENQPNFIKILIFNDLLKNTSFINKNTKKKYYQLLIDSFNNNKINDHSEEITKIKDLFTKSDLNDFEEIDMYIELFIAENENKNEVDNFNEDSTDRAFFQKFDNKKNNLNVKISDNYLLDNNSNSNNSPLSPLPLKSNSDNEISNKISFEEFNNDNILEDVNNNMSDNWYE